MKLFKNDFIRPFAAGFVVASALVAATMFHAPQATQSLLPPAHAASATVR